MLTQDSRRTEGLMPKRNHVSDMPKQVELKCSDMTMEQMCNPVCRNGWIILNVDGRQWNA